MRFAFISSPFLSIFPVLPYFLCHPLFLAFSYLFLGISPLSLTFFIFFPQMISADPYLGGRGVWGCLYDTIKTPANMYQFSFPLQQHWRQGFSFLLPDGVGVVLLNIALDGRAQAQDWKNLQLFAILLLQQRSKACPWVYLSLLNYYNISILSVWSTACILVTDYLQLQKYWYIPEKN